MKKVLILHNIFHPDSGVSAGHYTELALGLRRRGWDVTVLATNREYRDAGKVFPAREVWNGIGIIRVNRPMLDMDNPVQRMLMSLDTICRWSAEMKRLESFDAILIGSNPPFAPLLSIPARIMHRGAKIVHWCFDVYPDAIEADRLSTALKPLAWISRKAMEMAYGRFDTIVDLGPCMRSRMRAGPDTKRATLEPWAFAEPAEFVPVNMGKKRNSFGTDGLVVLYSGTMGRAHEHRNLLGLARECRKRGVAAKFVFACRDGRDGVLKRDLRAEDTNISVTEFVPEDRLKDHLCSADVHMMSLKPAWTGISVPSKFFGSLATGRPIIYDGLLASDIGCTIAREQVGMVLDSGSLNHVVDWLSSLSGDAGMLNMLQRKAFELYRRSFSRESIIDRLEKELTFSRS